LKFGQIGSPSPQTPAEEGRYRTQALKETSVE
jgi:hypothetical protein